MSILVYIAMHIIKPALIMATIISCIVASYILTQPTKGQNKMKYNTRKIRKMIKAIGRVKTVQMLNAKGLTLRDFGIM